MSVTPQVRINGGAPGTGSVAAAVGDTIQVTAASMATWTTPVARWWLYSFPPDFTVPAGWIEDASSGAFYFDGNSDPPSFVANEWGKYYFHVYATDGGVRVGPVKVMVNIPSPSGLVDIARGEGAEYGGSRLRWVKGLQEDLRVLDTVVASVQGLEPSGDATGATDYARLQSLIDAGTSFKLGAGVWYLSQRLIVDPDANGIQIDLGDAELRPGSSWVASTADDRTNSMIRIAGSATGTVNTTLGTNEPMGSAAILLSSATGMPAGESFLRVSGNNNTTGIAFVQDTVAVSELMHVASSYASGTTVALHEVTAYAHDQDHVVVSWNPARNIEIIGGYLNGSASTVAVGIEVTDSYRVTIRDTKFRGFSRTSVDAKGSKHVALRDLVNRGDSNGFVITDSSHYVPISSPVATGEFGRQHTLGVTRHQFWFLNHCVAATVENAKLHKVAAVMAVWGGVNCGGDGWVGSDIDCAEIVNRAVAAERLSGMVGIVFEGGVGPVNDYTSIGYGAHMRNGVFTGVHQPTQNGQKWAYVHDHFQIELSNITVVNKGASPLDADGYLGGMLCSDVTGVLTGIQTSGTFRAIETNNFLADLLIDNCRFDASPGAGTFGVQTACHFDHQNNSSVLKLGTVEFANYTNIASFGTSFDNNNKTFLWNECKFDNFVYRDIVIVKTGSTVARGTVGRWKDPASPADGFDGVIESTGPSPSQFVFLHAASNNWALVATGHSDILHTGTAAKRGDFLVADALGNVVVNNNPPNGSTLWVARVASSGGRVHALRIASSPQPGTFTLSGSPAILNATGSLTVRCADGGALELNAGAIGTNEGFAIVNGGFTRLPTKTLSGTVPAGYAYIAFNGTDLQIRVGTTTRTFTAT